MGSEKSERDSAVNPWDAVNEAIRSDIATGARLRVLCGPNDYADVACGAVDRVRAGLGTGSAVDDLAQLIRLVDGDNTMGAAELAEHIIGFGYRRTGL